MKPAKLKETSETINTSNALDIPKRLSGGTIITSSTKHQY
jgi:hypothetical protein